MEHTGSSSSRTRSIPPSVVIALGTLLVIAIGVSGYLFYQYNQTQAELSYLQANPGEISDDQIDEIITRVGKHVLLPIGERPTVATVRADQLAALRQQEFFANADAGHQVLAYREARKAFLYDPEADRVVEVAPLVVREPAATASADTAPDTVNVAIYNGTDDLGIVAIVEGEITSDPDVTVVQRGTAQNLPYTQTTVVDLTGADLGQATAIADRIGGSVAILPEGESSPLGADILVIVGTDRL